MEKVYGDRTCRVCHGICHGKTYRTWHSQRRKYYCSEACARHASADQLRKRINDITGKALMSLRLTDEEWAQMRLHYEEVEVI